MISDELAQIVIDYAFAFKDSGVETPNSYDVIEKITEIMMDEPVVRTHIMREWDREKIVNFALHLLGDRCQECGTVKIANLESKLLRVCAACRAQGKITLCEECIAAE